MPLITLGELNQLRLKIPSKGDLNWSDDFKTQFAQKIVEHDHTGVDGKGAQLTGDSLADGSINRGSLLAIDLQDLPNVVDTYSDPNDPSTIQYSSGQVLKYNASTNMWAPGTEGSNVKAVSQTAQVEAFGPGTVVNISSIDNINNATVDMTSQTSFSSIFVMVNLPNPTTQKVILPKMINCIIISNVDIDFSDKVINSKVIIRREGGFCTANLLSGASFEGCNVECDRLTVSAHSNIDKTYFLQSVAKIDTLQTNLTNNNSNKVVIDQSQVSIDTLSNTASLTTSVEYLKLQNKAQVTVKDFNATFPVDATRVNLADADAMLISVGDSNKLTCWDGTRFNHIASPSGINKFITADANGNPTEISVPSGSVAVARSSGFTTEQYKFVNLDDVSTTVLTSGNNYPIVQNANVYQPSDRLNVDYITTSNIYMDIINTNTGSSSRLKLEAQSGTVDIDGGDDVSITAGDNASLIALNGNVTVESRGAGNYTKIDSDSAIYLRTNNEVGLSNSNIVIQSQTITFNDNIDVEQRNSQDTFIIDKQYSMPSVDATPYIEFKSGSTNAGDIFRVATSSVQYNTSSDYRLKENVKSIENASSMIMQLNPCTFEWKEDKIKDCGFIAHEVDEIYPYTVIGEKDAVNEDGSIKPQSMDYGKMTPLLTAALQEALVKIDSLEARIKELEDKK